MDHHRKAVSSPDSALAGDLFEKFCSAQTLKSILGHFRHLCQVIHIQPTNFPQFYPKLKAKLVSWKAQALWNKFDKRASHKCYNRGKVCHNTRVLVIGAGPCGLRAAIEAQLLGAKVVIIEKRDRISRNNVLHLWPYVIHDLRGLGAKKFFGKFCAGAIDHISIRQLQCILLKVALIFGVEIHEGVSFESLAPPPPDQNEKIGWRAVVGPSDHPMSQYEFDVLIGADGKRNTLDGFKRKEFRGKLAIAITANFINRRTKAEARVEEISGVAFIFNQKFFKELYDTTGIDLENIVYYKDETHYFVMTAKKHSLIDKGVILNDYPDTSKLLSVENVDRTALMDYAKEAADFSTRYQLPHLEFAVNHYGQPDVAMFDFTSMYAAENASRVLEVQGHRLLVTLVGDSLLEPFWPTGSGCARGFLSCMDACWAVRSWALGNHSLQVIAERESVYRLLAQTTPENLHRHLQGYTLDPQTRYPNLNLSAVLPEQVKSFFITDDMTSTELFLKAPSYIPDVPKKRRRKGKDSQVHPETLLHWLQKQVVLYDNLRIEDMNSSFKDGLALCAIIHRYRPHLIDYHSINKDDIAKNNQLAFDILEKEFSIPPVMTGEEMAACDVPDKLALLSYLSQVYDAFRGEIPHIKHAKIEVDEEKEENAKVHAQRVKNLSKMTPNQKVSLLGRIASKGSAPKHRESLPKKRRSTNPLESYEYRRQRFEEIERNRQERMMRRIFLRQLANQRLYKSMQMLQANAKLETSSEPFEDYSIFLYRQTAADFKDRVKLLEDKLLYPDRESRTMENIKKGCKDQDFNLRVKDLEAKLRGALQDKKPKDLLRAIGKIEKTDWNVKEIEKKMEENRMGRGLAKEAEKVPKWSKQQFEDKYSVMKKKLQGQEKSKDNLDNKYMEVDMKMANLEKKIKEGTVRDVGMRGSNKVSAMAAHLATMHQEPEPPKHMNGRSGVSVTVANGGGSEICHFCQKRVYLMERLSAEGKFFHRGCFRCQHCSTTLRLGNYAYDREGRYGNKFFCVQHFGLQGVVKDRYSKESKSTPKRSLIPLPSTEETDKASPTPERIEFENLSESVEVEEDEWTDRNFGATSTDNESSDISDTSSESGDEEAFAEPLEAGLDPEETLRLAEDWTRRYVSCTDSSYHDSPDEESDSKESEAEEMKLARELRKKEVPPEPIRTNSDTGSETEVASDEYSDTSSEESEPEDNSATEISTDSEFEHDGTTHLIPDIVISDTVQVKKGELEEVKQVQLVNRPLNGKIEAQSKDIKLELRKLEDWKSPALSSQFTTGQEKPKPLLNPNKGDYLLNRTQSTEGIASKISLELKKKYLLGSNGSVGNVRKSGSASTLDSKFKSLIDQISENQKMLNPAPEPSATMQAILQGADKIKTSPIVSPLPNLLPKKQLPPFHEFKHICGLKEKEVNIKDDKILPVGAESKENIKPDQKKDDEEMRSRSPVHETRIVVPDFPRAEIKHPEEMESDSLSSDDSSTSEEDSIECNEAVLHSPPKVEIHNSRGELMEEDAPTLDSLNLKIPDVCQNERVKDKVDLVPASSSESRESSLGKLITVPSVDKDGELLKKVPHPRELYVTPEPPPSPPSPGSAKDDSDSFKNESLAAALTETELSDWARDEEGMVSETLDDLELSIDNQFIGFRKHQGPKNRRNARGVAAKIAKAENFDEEYTHVCGKIEKPDYLPISNVLHNVDNIQFMDTGEESSTDDDGGVKNRAIRNSGYIQFVNPSDDEDELPTPLVEAQNFEYLAPKEDEDSKNAEFTDTTTTTSDATTVKNPVQERSSSSSASELRDKPKPLEPTDSKEYAKYVQRLQGRISPFRNARDSIGIIKNRKHKLPSSKLPDENLHECIKPTNLNQNQDLNQENETPTTRLSQTSPTTSRKLEQISKERSLQKDLVHEMVMNKLVAQGKSPIERNKKRSSRGSSTSLAGMLSSPVSSVTSLEQLQSNIKSSNGLSKASLASGETPKRNLPTPKRWRGFSNSVSESGARPRSVTVSESMQKLLPTTPSANSEAFSLPDIHKAVESEMVFKTPLSVSTTLRSDLRSSAKAKYKMMSDEELGLSPEDKLRRFRERFNKYLSSSQDKLPTQTPSKSGEGKKTKDSERKRSIIQAVSDFFHKKSPSPPKTPSSHSPTKSSKIKNTKSKESVSEEMPPPIPPLPQLYTPAQDDSWSEDESKLAQCGDPESVHKRSKLSQRMARQALNKRLRMAQEVQRQLEEVEVKQRELEARGVAVEKALRGEEPGVRSDDQSLLKEWFSLMRERSKLRAYEKELMVSAEELELEDRHSRLQRQFKLLVASPEKSEEDVALQGSLLGEMLNIVKRKEQLACELSAERQRRDEEYRDLEAQMLAKGLVFNSMRKT